MLPMFTEQHDDVFTGKFCEKPLDGFPLHLLHNPHSPSRRRALTRADPSDPCLPWVLNKHS